MIKIYAFFFVIILTTTSCTSLPKGRNVLEEEFIKDSLSPLPELKKNEFVNSGRPIYIEGIVYPQMIEGGHIALEGKVGIFIGRESIGINRILNIHTGSLENETEELNILKK